MRGPFCLSRKERKKRESERLTESERNGTEDPLSFTGAEARAAAAVIGGMCAGAARIKWKCLAPYFSCLNLMKLTGNWLEEVVIKARISR